MNIPLFEQFHRQGLITDDALNDVKENAVNKTINVHRELTLLLYIGVLLTTTGLGILVYKNIDSIGHIAIVCFIGITCAACFGYCLKKSTGFKYDWVQSPNHWFDYILLLGCLLLLIFIGYLQFQFAVFGNRWEMAIFIPMLVLFITAYYFDYIGALSLAITNLAAWVGITITPLHMFQNNDFSATRIIYPGIILGALLIVAGALSKAGNIKRHFSFTYKNFGAHLLYVSLIAAMAYADLVYLIWFFVIAGVSCYYYFAAAREGSFYFLVVAAIYFYVALSYVIIRGLLSFSGGDGSLYLTLLYLIFSALILILFLIRQNKRHKHAGIS